MNYLKKLKAISSKGLTKDSINKISALNGAKYFKKFQYLYQLKKILDILLALLGLNRLSLMEYQKNVLKI